MYIDIDVILFNTKNIRHTNQEMLKKQLALRALSRKLRLWRTNPARTVSRYV